MNKTNEEYEEKYKEIKELIHDDSNYLGLDDLDKIIVFLKKLREKSK